MFIIKIWFTGENRLGLPKPQNIGGFESIRRLIVRGEGIARGAHLNIYVAIWFFKKGAIVSRLSTVICLTSCNLSQSEMVINSHEKRVKLFIWAQRYKDFRYKESFS